MGTLSKIKNVGLTVARFLLGLGMVPYAVSKLAGQQFQVPPSEYGKDLGAIDGIGPTWAFMGHSTPFEVLLGVAELVPAVLVLFRRTRVLGALLMLPPTVGVFLVNFMMHLWPETRVVSAVLLGLNLVVLLGEWATLRVVLATLLGRAAPPARWRTIENGVSASLAVLAIGGVYLGLRSVIAQQLLPTSDFTGERQINGAGAWSVDAILIDGRSALPASPTRIFFDLGHRCVLASGTERLKGRFEANRDARTFELTSLPLGDGDAPIRGTYEREGDRLVLHGARDAAEVRIALSPWRW